VLPSLATSFKLPTAVTWSARSVRTLQRHHGQLGDAADMIPVDVTVGRLRPGPQLSRRHSSATPSFRRLIMAMAADAWWPTRSAPRASGR